MDLLDRLKLTQLGFNGKQPPKYGGNDPASKLHFTYTLNGQPPLKGFPAPTRLSMGGKTPKKYLDNPPK